MSAELKAVLDAVAGLGSEAKQAIYAYFALQALNYILGFLVLALLVWLARWAMIHYSKGNDTLMEMVRILDVRDPLPDWSDVKRAARRKCEDMDALKARLAAIEREQKCATQTNPEPRGFF